MNMSFYTAISGAGSQQLQMDVVANNLANANTTGYKAKQSVFAEHLYRNLSEAAQVQSNLKAGVGVGVHNVKSNYTQGGFDETGGANDYAILGRGFFMLQDPNNQQISYTRDGRFEVSQRGDAFYLATTDGKLVLYVNRNPIRIGDENTNLQMEERIGIFGFSNLMDLKNLGENEFVPGNTSGMVYLDTESTLKKGALELSNVDVAVQFGKIMESQRAYSYALKMIQTSDEVTESINALR